MSFYSGLCVHVARTECAVVCLLICLDSPVFGLAIAEKALLNVSKGTSGPLRSYSYL